ncbi:TRAFAC clade GTPase domain-containing protein [Phyllobacterium chamaecytisi]|uniref:TRAFAC clade GTPase domain-containing protein n=1 Tax=Phyllobacterium chamaecytisi TaxID=2876082 RepID=UPI001CCA8529|nr:hypothetical protein [Phyllobacterium sp. KW56]
MIEQNSILVIGESGVGKTHFGAQLLQRLMGDKGRLRMDGAASNLEPFEGALESLNEGRAAAHTATSTYLDSIWPVSDAAGARSTKLIWPDYGGEQVRSISSSRRVPVEWLERVKASSSWLLLLRLQQTRVGDDIFSRPLNEQGVKPPQARDVHMSDQARMVELLQILLFANASSDPPVEKPNLSVLLTCWDELPDGFTPQSALASRMPMLESFIRCNWTAPIFMGVSALERPLSPHERDAEYVARGPEEFGYIVESDGTKSQDLTIAIDRLLRGVANGRVT